MRWGRVILALAGVAAATACGSFGSSDDTPTPPGADGGADALASDGGGGGDAAACDPGPDLSVDCPANRLRCTAAERCEHDALTDKFNCGVCGRVCESTCVNGTCVPLKLDDKQSTAGVDRAVGADDAHAYWVTADGTAWQVPLDGGGVTGQGASIAGAGGFVDVAQNGDTFFLLSTGNVTRAIIDGTADILVENLTATNNGRLALDATRVFFTEGRDTGVVGSVRKDGDGGLVRLATGQHRPSHVIVGKGGVVFVNQASPAPATDGAIVFVPTDPPGSPLEKIPGLPQVGALVADGDTAFYTLVDRGEIWSVDLGTFKTSQVASGLGEVAHLAVDATNLYYTSKPTSGAKLGIYRMARCGKKTTLVTADTAGIPTGLVQRDAYVYWSAFGALYRTSK